jgi:hypothetical protein
MGIRAFAIGLTVAWAAIGGARAADVVFTITGGDATATFELPLSPTLDVTVAPFFFGILSVPAVVGGSPVTLPGLYFFSTELGETGGFFAEGFFSFSGPQFYTGSESNPTFLTGVYPGLVNGFGGKIDTVTVIDPPRRPRRPRTLHMGDVAARLRRPELCRLQEGEETHDSSRLTG